MARPRVHDDALRTRLLESASQVISEHGVGALTVRDVAHRSGTSASAVYALFGGRDALVAAVGDEGFRRFGAHLAAVPRTDDAAADLLALGLAYRDSALADPHFYRVMFDTVGTGAQEPGSGPATARPTFVALHDAVARVLDDLGVPADPEQVALVLWAQVHGLVQLELAGLLPGSPDERSGRYAGALRTAGAAAFGAGTGGPTDDGGTPPEDGGKASQDGGMRAGDVGAST